MPGAPLGRSERAFFEGAQAHQDGAVHWGDIAQASGYADQAHMGHEFRRWLGTTPGALGTQAGLLSALAATGFG